MPKTRPSRILFYLKIVKAERKAEGENEVFELGFAEAHPILGEAKENQSRAQRKDENEVFDLNDAEAHPVIWKDKQSPAQSRRGSEVLLRERASPAIGIPNYMTKNRLENTCRTTAAPNPCRIRAYPNTSPEANLSSV